ncbi:MAG TPA: hypothetical protein DEF85_04210 [Clostridiaceae bacterium]|nr:hypothetical protein [Clostridiaceae bacterium]HBF78190.1 hypothetical protein [Clostridiaceae bacterium]HBG37747.1 hypothetical protein [Clostridiaceae bacterium]HBN29297.1 hypothetical protein [Clostridiaceae bacterium]HBX48077.1 hypothetical protein [Clostridiaceae bacterium]
MIILIKVVNKLSVIFAVLSFIMSDNVSKLTGNLLYLWLCLSSFLILKFKEKNKAASYIFSILIFLPLFIPSSTAELIYKIVVVTFCLVLTYIGSKNISYGQSLEEVKKETIAIGVLFIISFLGNSLKYFEDSSAEYVMVYFVSSIILLRMQRYYDNVKDNNKANIQRFNIIAPLLILCITIILSLETVRNAVLNFLVKAYLIFADILGTLLTWLFYAIGFLIMIASNAIKKLIERLDKKDLPPEEESFNDIKHFAEKNKGKLQGIHDSKMLALIFKIALIALILYIFYRIYKKNYGKNAKEEKDYEAEEREFIKKEDNVKHTLFNRIINTFNFNKEENEIRNKYKKFMKICIKKGIPINGSDTTGDINTKSKGAFNSSNLNVLRCIYIKVRYGNKNINEEEEKKFNLNYDEIKSQK